MLPEIWLNSLSLVFFYLGLQQTTNEKNEKKSKRKSESKLQAVDWLKQTCRICWWSEIDCVEIDIVEKYFAIWDSLVVREGHQHVYMNY
ncbi:hypothetical protein Hanom_Chr12g01162171 [Helianthus anomalus]